MIIGFDWVSKFTLNSLLRALKSLYTSKCLLALNWIHCLNRSNGIHYWCYSNQIGIYMYVNLHGQSNQRKGDILYKYLRLNPPWNEGNSIWYKTLYLHITCKSEKNLTFNWGGFLPRNEVDFKQKIWCAFQIIILMEPTISNTLYLKSLPLSRYSKYVSLKKVTKHKQSLYKLCQVSF